MCLLLAFNDQIVMKLFSEEVFEERKVIGGAQATTQQSPSMICVRGLSRSQAPSQ